MTTTTKQKPGVIPQIVKNSVAFAAAFVAMLVLTFGFLGVMDALPDPAKAVADVVPAQTGVHANTVHATEVATVKEQPVRVVAHDIGLNVSVSNPVSTSVAKLDEALLTGAVRYPTSAFLGQNGTVLLFGHSSYLPIVHNQAYKAFDGIQNLKTGSIVSVYSSGHEYRYAVVGVELADATKDVVQLGTAGKHLVLVTCDSFSKKTTRFVVTADFVGAYPVAN